MYSTYGILELDDLSISFLPNAYNTGVENIKTVLPGIEGDELAPGALT